jgi:hypothetical protein
MRRQKTKGKRQEAKVSDVVEPSLLKPLPFAFCALPFASVL